MWYMVKYFDGESVKTRYLGYDEKSFRISISPSSLIVFALYPLSNLSPFGGFWESGDKKEVYLLPEYGYFASMIIDAALTMPEAVRDLSVRAIREDYPDLGLINRDSFLSYLYQGKLTKENIKLSKRYTIPLKGVLRGYWISLFSHQDSFNLTQSNEDNLTLSLFPGIWYYLSKERELMLQIIVSESGEYWLRTKQKPKWT